MYYNYWLLNLIFSYVVIHPSKMYKIMKTRIRIRFVYDTWYICCRTDNDSLQDLANVVQKSARGNKAIVVNDAFCWYDWKTFLLSTDFSPLSEIPEDYFRLSAMQPGVVFVKEKFTDPGKAINILRNKDAIFFAAYLPSILGKGTYTSIRLDKNFISFIST